ncbi:hypothetical protein [Actinacidiphila oryziradicis]|uniref:MOSC domain-containing protein n=1 Tax=Actinacidiphila oryziradicis TaxID=2571141 RepID=A0A4U0T8T4_9ACTN|nr:hypothetical protein [Actinacidiphila oryziradicis]TKA11665.1 hypothetical protein FCI23_09990 [Actinacidiphila oryziradicis]
MPGSGGWTTANGRPSAQWFSDALRAPSRLVRGPPGFDRDGWGERITTGGAGFGYATRCIRCAVPMFDRRTGLTAAPSPSAPWPTTAASPSTTRA